MSLGWKLAISADGASVDVVILPLRPAVCGYPQRLQVYACRYDALKVYPESLD